MRLAITGPSSAIVITVLILAFAAAVVYVPTPGLPSSSSSTTTATSGSTSSSTVPSGGGGGYSTTMSSSSSSQSSATSVSSSQSQTTTQSGSSGSRRLGFWLQEADITNCTWQGGYQQCGATDPAQLFYNSMFLTQPYPSSLEVMIFAILQAQTNGQGCTNSSGYIGSSLKFWDDLGKLANAHPNIRLVYEIAFDPSNGGNGVYGLACFNSMVQSFGHYPSIYGIGIEGEYTTKNQGLTNSEVQSAMNDVTAAGKVFINYYLDATIPQGGYFIAHTNFPGGDAGGYDQVGTLQATGSQIIGLDSGYYASFQFPGTVTCPIGPNSMSSQTAGWNDCVVSTELNTAVSLPSGSRQFLEVDVGYSSSGSFTGVSGQSTSQVWDNPTLRSWLWTDPNYQGQFILST